MAYQPTDWRNGETALSAEHMNNIEEGIQEALNAVKPSEIKPTLVDIIYPVGSIYMSVNDTDPSILFGGTWTRWGQGRVPVGVNESETEFNAAEKADGAKTHTLTAAQMPSHTHTQNAHNHTQDAHTHTESGSGHLHTFLNGKWGLFTNANDVMSDIADNISGSTNKYPTIERQFTWYSSNGTEKAKVSLNSTQATNRAATATNQNTGGGQAHNNLQPYITCYMWKRTE